MEENNKEKKRKKIIKKIKHKSRLVVMNDDTFEEQFSMVLSPLNVFAWGGLFLLVFSLVLTVIIAFTPLRELIPGYADVNTRKRAMHAAIRADSIQRVLVQNETYMANLKNILTGGNGLVADSVSSKNDSTNPNLDNLDFTRSAEDDSLRKLVEEAEKYNINPANSKNGHISIQKMLLFPPIKGVLSSHFNPSINHFGVDVLPSVENSSVSAVYAGTVIQASWTAEEGHVLFIQHAGNLVSVYKHNSVLFKKVGEQVKAGEDIGIVGNSGELSTGTHLHFELWFKGAPVDPEHYLVF